MNPLVSVQSKHDYLTQSAKSGGHRTLLSQTCVMPDEGTSITILSRRWPRKPRVQLRVQLAVRCGNIHLPIVPSFHRENAETVQDQTGRVGFLYRNERLLCVRPSTSKISPMLLLELRTALKQVGDPIRATAMQAYMKSAMPYHGVPTPSLRQVCKATFADVRFRTASQWQAQVLDLWRDARFREDRYAALYLDGDKRARPLSDAVCDEDV
jgi:hypothetical protein